MNNEKPRGRSADGWSPKQKRLAGIGLLLGASVASLAAGRWYLASQAGPQGMSLPAPDAMEGGSSSITTEASAALPNTLSVAEDRWATHGIVIEPAQSGPFSRTTRLTGKVSLNQDQIAHIYPMVEGAVDSVTVGLGQSVKANDLLIVIHSREIGQAKLELYQAKLQQEMALVKQRLQSEVASNARGLLSALRENQPITEIENQFRNRPMGDFRERLLASYSSYLKSQADVLRLEGVSDSGAISAKQLLAAQATRNADLATFQARIEQIEYEMATSLLMASQAVKEAETRVAVAATNLRILGCDQADIDSVDPASQGEAISHYPIRAPFDGTVITKDVVLSEQVRPDVMLLSIADLSSVWITADVYEEHVPLLSSLAGKEIQIRNEAWPDRVFAAKIFFTGEIMDEATRTISMRAVAENRERLLKPGMFVSIELPEIDETRVLAVPLAAIQDHDGRQFLFVHVKDDQFERRDVMVGPANGSQIIIRQGLQEGEQIVTQGGFLLKSQLLAGLMGEE
jgi:cobalt-zinc-cadmium efflux system membrane fusion protein